MSGRSLHPSAASLCLGAVCAHGTCACNFQGSARRLEVPKATARQPGRQRGSVQRFHRFTLLAGKECAVPGGIKGGRKIRIDCVQFHRPSVSNQELKDSVKRRRCRVGSFSSKGFQDCVRLERALFFDQHRQHMAPRRREPNAVGIARLCHGLQVLAFPSIWPFPGSRVWDVSQSLSRGPSGRQSKVRVSSCRIHLNA